MGSHAMVEQCTIALARGGRRGFGIICPYAVRVEVRLASHALQRSVACLPIVLRFLVAHCLEYLTYQNQTIQKAIESIVPLSH